MRPHSSTTTRTTQATGSSSLPITLGPTEPSATSPCEEGHWRALAQKVSHEHRDAAWVALSQVAELFAAEVAADPGSDAVLLSKCHQMKLILQDAHCAKEPTTFVDQFASLSGDVAFALQRRAGVYADYGGALGRAIFAAIWPATVPRCASLVRAFANEVKDIAHDDQCRAATAFLRVLLTEMGKDRGRIALMTATSRAEQFGRMSTYGSMRDTNIGSQGWGPWKVAILQRIHDVVVPAWPARQVLQLSPQEQAFVIKTDKSVVSMRRGRDSTWVCSWINPEDPVSTRFSFVCRLQDEGDKMTLFDVESMSCEHRPREYVDACSLMASDFVDLMSPRGVEDLDQIKASLASMLHVLSNSTTFDRGQAAISEKLFEVVANALDYSFDFSQEWKSETAPQPDQRALVQFNDKPRFVREAAENFVMVKLGQ